MKTLLLAGHYFGEIHQSPALQTTQQELQITRAIRALRQLPYEITVVLGGSDSEDILRNCRELENCELVFDTNGYDASLWTNLKAGAWASNDWFLVHTIESATKPMDESLYLVQQNAQLTAKSGVHVLALDKSPLLLSREGNQFIKTHKDLTGFEDPRLMLRRLETLVLASRAQTL